MTHPIRCRLNILLLIIFCLEAPSSLQAVPFEKEQSVSVYHQQTDSNGYTVFADNHLPVPVFILFNFKTLQSYKPDRLLPVDLVLPPGAKQVELVKLTATRGKKRQFLSSYTFGIGNPLNTKPDKDYLYLFPFEHGRKFKVGQGFNGKATHFGRNQFAVDFDMPVGTPVCAARDGIVVELKQDSDKNGIKPEYNNYLSLFHSDGTIGTYGHLRQNSVKLHPGDMVKTGELLAYSGNTGFSSGPHLHFEVGIPLKNGTRQSIAIKFLNHDSTPALPEEGLYYYSFHPGGADFEVKLGRLLQNRDFSSWAAKVSPVADKAEIRVEKIDATMVLFIRNPLTRPINAEVGFNLHNMRSSNGKRVQMRVPPETELFLTLLNPQSPLKPSSFSSDLNYRYNQ